MLSRVWIKLESTGESHDVLAHTHSVCRGSAHGVLKKPWLGGWLTVRSLGSLALA